MLYGVEGDKLKMKSFGNCSDVFSLFKYRNITTMGPQLTHRTGYIHFGIHALESLIFLPPVILQN